MKQLETKSVIIGEYTFYIRPFPAFKAAKLTGELTGLVAPLISGLLPIAGNSKDKSVLDVDLEPAIPAISAAFSTLSGDKLEVVLKHLLITGRNVSVSGPGDEKAKLLTEDTANEIFCAEVQDMFILAFEVIRTNYNGFFKKLATQFGPAISAWKKMSKK